MRSSEGRIRVCILPSTARCAASYSEACPARLGFARLGFGVRNSRARKGPFSYRYLDAHASFRLSLIHFLFPHKRGLKSRSRIAVASREIIVLQPLRPIHHGAAAMPDNGRVSLLYTNALMNASICDFQSLFIFGSENRSIFVYGG